MKKTLLKVIITFCLLSNKTLAQYWSIFGEGMGNVPFYDEAWVNALAMYNGELYAGGVFDTAGSIPVNRIAKWNGTTWSPVGEGVILHGGYYGGYSGHVRTMIVYEGELYVGGFFDSAGGIAAKNIAKWNGTTWSSVGTGSNNVVIDFATYNGELYAGGAFDTIGGIPANRIAKWNGTTWKPLGAGIDLDYYGNHPTSVYSLVVHNGALYAGGAFDTAGTVPANNIAKWDGNNWSALHSGLSHGVVRSLVSYQDHLYAGGEFWQAGNVQVNHVAKWDGNNWSPVGTGTDFAPASLAVFEGILYAGGFYPNYNDGTGDGVGEYYSSNFISKWDGTYWSGLGQGVNNNVYKLLAADSSLYIGGHFTYADTLPANRIARWLGNCLNPVQPSIINGNDVVCNSSTQTYFVDPAADATSYTWILPMEWPGSSNTNSITTIPYYDGEFTISVRANNGCGNSLAQTLTINVLLPPVSPEYITGSTVVCGGSTQNYSVNPIPGITNYSWTLPAGWIGSSATSSITVTTGINGGNISVKANNTCGNSAERILPVRVDSVLTTPITITGNIFVSANQTDTYSINSVNGATGYNWSLSGGGTILTGQNTNSVTVSWEIPGEYTLSVNANNSCGPGRHESLTIKVSPLVAEYPFSIKLYPNPSSGQFYLKAKRIQDKMISIDVYTMSGQLVYRSGKKQGINDYFQLIDLKKMSPGIYAVRIMVDDKVFTKPMFVTK